MSAIAFASSAGADFGVSDWYLEVIRPFVKKHHPTVGFSPTEAAAIAVLYAFIVTVLIYREITFSDMPQILLKTGITTAVVFLLTLWRRSRSLLWRWCLQYFMPVVSLIQRAIKSQGDYMALACPS